MNTGVHFGVIWKLVKY